MTAPAEARQALQVLDNVASGTLLIRDADGAKVGLSRNDTLLIMNATNALQQFINEAEQNATEAEREPLPDESQARGEPPANIVDLDAIAALEGGQAKPNRQIRRTTGTKQRTPAKRTATKKHA